jgi:hypothetical protein
MGGSGRGFRGVRWALLGCVSALALTPGVLPAAEESRPIILAQAGMLSNQPRSERPAAAPPAAPAPAIVAPRPPASIAQPPAAPAPAIAAPKPPAAVVQPPVAASAPAQPFGLAESPGGYTARNLAFSAGPSSYVIPSAEIRGTNLSRDELARLLDPASGTSLAQRINGLAASEVVIPELRAETAGTAGRQSAVYRDIRLSNVGSGRISSAQAASGSFDSPAPEGPTRGTFARMDVSDIDLGTVMSLLDDQPTPAPGELKRIYGAFSVEGMATEGPKGARFRVARMAGRDFRARPTRDGWTASAKALAGHTDLNEASPEERSRTVSAMVDLLEAFDIGSLEASGIEFSDAGGPDKAGRISRIAYTGGGSAEFRIEGIDVGAEDGRVRVATFSIGGISTGAALTAARELAGKTAALTPGEIRRLVPTIGSVRLSGIEVDTKTKGTTATVPVSLGSLELLADKPVEGIPTDLRLTLRNLSVPVAAAGEDDTAKQLAGLGYNKIEASMTAALGWNEAGQELVIRELSADGAGMGSVRIRGVVGNVPRDAFSADEAMAAIAWVGATARSIDVVVQNTGLFERLLASQAAEKKKTVDELRREYGMTAAVGIPLMLGNSAPAKALGQAVARFIAKPGRLTIEARTRDSGGLGFADFAASPDPTALLEKVEIKATAE